MISLRVGGFRVTIHGEHPSPKGDGPGGTRADGTRDFCLLDRAHRFGGQSTGESHGDPVLGDRDPLDILISGFGIMIKCADLMQVELGPPATFSSTRGCVLASFGAGTHALLVIQGARKKRNTEIHVGPRKRHTHLDSCCFLSWSLSPSKGPKNGFNPGHQSRPKRLQACPTCRS